MDSKLLEIFHSLPQSGFLSDDALTAFVSQIERRGEDVYFHANRLNGFGGSDVGALLRHHYPAFAAAPGYVFNSAQDIISTKLMKRLSILRTPQADRGSRIEPLIRDSLHAKLGVESNEELMAATRKHASNPFMSGNCDDAITVGSRNIILDYKSTVSGSELLDFGHVAQLHHYGEIAESNDVKVDQYALVTLRSSEDLLGALASVADNKHSDPEAYAHWVKTLSLNSVPGLELDIKPISKNPHLSKMCSHVCQHYGSEYLMKGKLLKSAVAHKILNPQEEAEVSALAAQADEILVVQSVANKQLDKLNARISDIMGQAKPDMGDLCKDGISTISSRMEVNQRGAIEALEAKGVNVDALKENKGLDVDALAKKVVELGGDINDPELSQKKLSNMTIIAALESHGIDANLYVSHKNTLSAGRGKAQKALLSERVEMESLVFNSEPPMSSSLATEQLTAPANKEESQSSQEYTLSN